MSLRFGDCAFDSETRELLRRGEPVHVSPKAFRLLELLIASRPKALSKAELLKTIWPATFVSEGNLASLAAEVRAAVGQKARETSPIRTVYAHGYAFSGAVVEDTGAGAPVPAPPARHWIVWKKRESSLGGGENILGRGRDAAIVIDDTTVSRHHARIMVAGTEASLEDLGSKNGTWVEGKPVRRSVALSDGDKIKLGSVILTFRCSGPDQSTETIRRGERARRARW